MNWIDITGGFRRRDYENYGQYIHIQGEKLRKAPGTGERFSIGIRGSLGKRLDILMDEIPTSGNVLCLGARVGGEVRAFIDKGYFAIGIDLEPGENNHHVLHGDFHNLVFQDRTIDIVYTNSLDHVLDFDKIIGEVYRVLKPQGIFLTENKGGTKEPGYRGSKSDSYDCMEWLTLQHLIDFITVRGFKLVHRYRGKGFTPWGIIYEKLT